MIVFFETLQRGAFVCLEGTPTVMTDVAKPKSGSLLRSTHFYKRRNAGHVLKALSSLGWK